MNTFMRYALLTALTVSAGACLSAHQAQGRLAPVEAMPSPRAVHSATRLHDGRVLIVGGCTADGCEEGLSTDALLFDPESGRYIATGSPQIARAGHRAVPLQDGSVLIFGGWTENGPTDVVERYEPGAGAFERYGRMHEARDGFTATMLDDGSILIAGGYADGMRRLASAERFDPTTRRSTAVSGLATARMSHTATLLHDGRVLIAGGSDARGSVTPTLEVFNPASSQFAAAGRLDKARHKHAAVRLGNDVLILGGAAIPESAGHFQDSEIWRADVADTESGPSMREGRYKFSDSVVALRDGRVLVGGSGSDAEILSPDHRQFLPLSADIGRKLAFATATPLADGRVLILGGYDPAMRVDRGAWIFE